MPELPEVEIVRRGLSQSILGKSVQKVDVYRDRSIAFPSIDCFCKSLIGRKFQQINRRGKYLICLLDDDSRLVIHLGMSGRLLLTGSNRIVNKHVRVRIFLNNKQELLFEDQRVFGHFWLIPKDTKAEDIIVGLAKMGVEPFEQLTAEHLLQSFRGRKQPIKTALLGQHIVAGLGNIYADETLFLAGIYPSISAGKLKIHVLQKLVETITMVLNDAITAGGSTLRNYTDSQGINGNYQHKAWVYGRTGKPCRRCKSEIQRVQLGGRSTHFCPSCQS